MLESAPGGIQNCWFKLPISGFSVQHRRQRSWIHHYKKRGFLDELGSEKAWTLECLEAKRPGAGKPYSLQASWPSRL